MSTVSDGLRMAVGTLTVLPVRPPRVNRTVAGWAMLFAPVAAVPVAATAALVLGVLAVSGVGNVLPAIVALAVLALLTRGLHLDGLADLADGLGSARPAQQAVEIMRRSDIGPFGVLTLFFVLSIQVFALAQLLALGPLGAAAALVTAVLTGRLALTWACRGGVPAGRPEGLGSAVAGTVSLPAALLASLAVVGLAALAGLAGLVTASAWLPLVLALAVVGGIGAAEALRWYVVRRLGGITGDVLGGLCETATTVALGVVVLVT